VNLNATDDVDGRGRNTPPMICGNLRSGSGLIPDRHGPRSTLPHEVDVEVDGGVQVQVQVNVNESAR
jgi:hypothetical protein